MTTVQQLLVEHVNGLVGDYIPRDAANDFANWVERTHPQMATAHKDARFREELTIEIGRHRRSERTRLVRQGAARIFSEGADNLGAGAINGDVFLSEYIIDGKHTSRKLGDMCADDCAYVAEQYDQTAQVAAMKAALFWAVEKKVRNAGPAAVVRDVISPDKYLELVRSITGDT